MTRTPVTRAAVKLCCSGRKRAHQLPTALPGHGRVDENASRQALSAMYTTIHIYMPGRPAAQVAEPLRCPDQSTLITLAAAAPTLP